MRKAGARWELLRTLLALSLPAMAEEVLATLLQYVDTAMVGRLGEQATAAVSITTTITWLINSISGAVGIAVLSLISRAVGRGDRRTAGKLAQQALLLTLACGLVCGGASVLLSPYIPVWMGAEPAIRAEASRYFFIVSLPMVFRAAGTVLGAAVRATQNTRTPMLISMASNFLNAALNCLLIYVCALGVTGAAIASAVSYTVSGALMLWLFRRTAFLRWEGPPRPDRALLGQCARVGLPVLGTSMVSCLGYVVFASLVTDMGTTVFAAHSIAVTAETIFYVPGYGLRTATSALVGAALGEGDADKLRALCRLSVAMTVGMMALTGMLLFLTAEPLMALFTPERPVVRLGGEMLRLVALSEPFFGLMIVLEGIFYGLGRTRYAFCIETFSMWGVRILTTFLCVRLWGLGLRAVWYCMIADNVTKALLFALPFARGSWRARLLRTEAPKRE